MLRKLSLSTSVAVVALAVASPALAGSGNAEKPLPFAYSYEMVAQEGPGPLCTVPGEIVIGQQVGFVAIGTASHLGIAPADVQFCVGFDPLGQLRSYGTAVLTAADGDWLSFEFRGVPIDPVSATATIVPGTTSGAGRFFGAKVEGAGFAGEFGGYFDGTIAYDASSSSGTT